MRPSRRAILTSVLTLVVAAGGCAVAVPWIAKRGILQMANHRGWHVELGSARVGFRGISIDSVRLHIEHDPTRNAKITAAFTDTRIGWSALFGSRTFSATRGSASLTGELDALRDLVRGQRTTKDGSRPKLNHLTLDLGHIDVEWREQPSELPSLLIHDLNLERHADQWSMHAANLHGHYRGISIDLTDIASKQEIATPKPNDRGSSSLNEYAPWHTTAAELAIQYDSTRSSKEESAAGSSDDIVADSSASNQASSSTSSVVHSPTSSPVSTATVSAAVTHAATPATSTKRQTSVAATNQTKKTALNASETSTKKEFLPTVSWLIEQVDRLRLNVEKGTNSSRHDTWLSGLDVGSKFECPALRLRFVDEGQKLNLGPWPVMAERSEQQLIIELSQRASVGHSALSSKLVIEEQLDRASLRTAVGPIELPQLGISDGDFGLENIQAAQLALDVGAEFISKTGELNLESKGRLSGLSIRQPFLSRDTIKNMGFDWEGSLKLDSVKREITSEQLRIAIGPVVARLKGVVELASAYHAINGSLEIPLAACQDLFDMLPEGMTPLLRGWRVDRNFALRLTVAFDSRTPHKSAIGFRLDNQCRVLSVPAEVAPSKFERPFVLEVEDERGVLQPTNFGRGTW
ncbi:MAG TPA: hypothetical protein VIV60_02605, partial [Polyangiaceae bacterium]